MSKAVITIEEVPSNADEISVDIEFDPPPILDTENLSNLPVTHQIALSMLQTQEGVIIPGSDRVTT